MIDELQNIQQLFIHGVARGITEYLDASPEMQTGVENMARVITSETADVDDQAMSRNTLADWLWPQPAIDLETGEDVPE